LCKTSISSLVQGPTVSAVCVYRIQSARFSNDFEGMKCSVFCRRLDGEIVDLLKCRKKYQQLFYITFRSAVWYLLLHS